VFSLNIFHRIVLASTIFLLGALVIRAQDEAVIGGLAGLSVNAPVGTYLPIPGIPNPNGLPYSFSPTTTSIQPVVAVFADFKLSSLFRVGGRIGYSPLQLRYTANEQVPIATSNGGVYKATLQHRNRFDFSSVRVEPYLRITPTSWIAFDVGLPFMFQMGSDYLQTQIFTDPANLAFLDGSVEQITGSGIVPGTAIAVPGVSARIEGLVPASSNNSLFIVPSVGITRIIGSIHSTAKLAATSFQFALGIRYTLPAKSIPSVGKVTDSVFVADTVFVLSSVVKDPLTELTSTNTERFEKPDTTVIVVTNRYTTRLPKPPSVLEAAVRLSFINSSGDLSEEAQLKIWRVRRTRVVPLLPTVVFSENQTMVPEQYVRLSKSEASVWKEKYVANSTAHWQYNMLNVVGARMVKQPLVKLGLVVYDDGTAEGRQVADGRTKEIQKYLTDTFSINSKRISIEFRKGQASEQPWVFLVDSTRALLSPLTMIDTLTETRLPQVKIAPEVISEAGVKSWKIAALHNGKEVHVFEDKTQLPQAVLWDMNQDLQSTDVSVGQIVVKCFVTDNDGESVESSPAKINIRNQSITDASGLLAERVEILRVLGADYLNTPDEELFAGRKNFTKVVVQQNASDWYWRGLSQADMELFKHVEIYVSDTDRQ